MFLNPARLMARLRKAAMARGCTTAAYRRYADAAEAFLTGEPDGVRDWLLFCGEAFEAGAREVTGIADAVT
jgi:hypothetical protein